LEEGGAVGCQQRRRRILFDIISRWWRGSFGVLKFFFRSFGAFWKRLRWRQRSEVAPRSELPPSTQRENN